MNKTQLKSLIKEELKKVFSERIRSGSPEYMELQVAMRHLRRDFENTSVKMISELGGALFVGRQVPTPSEQITDPEIVKRSQFILDLAEKRIEELRKQLMPTSDPQPGDKDFMGPPY